MIGSWSVRFGGYSFIIPDIGEVTNTVILTLVKMFSKNPEFGYSLIELEYTTYAEPVKLRQRDA